MRHLNAKFSVLTPFTGMPHQLSLHLPWVSKKAYFETHCSSSSAGTGAVSSLFLLFPDGGGSTPMLIFSKIFFYLNLSTFTCFLILTVTKYTIYPGAWHSLYRNPSTSLYTSCFPMGATTLITVALKLFHDHGEFGGRGFLVFLWAMWWIDVGISFICCWVGVHVMYASAPFI